MHVECADVRHFDSHAPLAALLGADQLRVRVGETGRLDVWRDRADVVHVELQRVPLSTVPNRAVPYEIEGVFDADVAASMTLARKSLTTWRAKGSVSITNIAIDLAAGLEHLENDSATREWNAHMTAMKMELAKALRSDEKLTTSFEALPFDVLCDNEASADVDTPPANDFLGKLAIAIGRDIVVRQATSQARNIVEQLRAAQKHFDKRA